MARPTCSKPLREGRSYHIGLNFGRGGLQLYVDGQRADESGNAVLSGGATFKCSTDERGLELGIDGNDEPWSIGALAVRGEPGVVGPTEGPLGGVWQHVTALEVLERAARAIDSRPTRPPTNEAGTSF